MPEARHVELATVDRWWRAANYLSAAQIYLLKNALLEEPLEPRHIKPRLLGHWGTTPGLNFVYAHLTRLVRERDRQMIFVCGPGHGGPAVVANTWLEGSYGERYPDAGWSRDGLDLLVRQFSFPGGIPSHAAPETPGSLHEGGELGYSLAHAHGAAFDNPDLTVACVIGDGEAETGPLAASWQSHRFVDPRRDGAVLPILHLNSYKIAGPTILGRMSDDDLRAMFVGLGYDPIFVSGHDPSLMHPAMARALDAAADAHDAIRSAGEAGARWPLIILRSPKGWTGPDVVDGAHVEGTFRSHQVPLAGVREDPAHLRQLEGWLRSYRPSDLFEPDGRPAEAIRAMIPSGDLRMGMHPATNGGVLVRDLDLPPVADYALDVAEPGRATGSAAKAAGRWLADVIRRNPDRFRLFSPDETESNRLGAVFEATSRTSPGPPEPGDEDVARDGRVMEVLSEHLCQGWLEGYLLTGRHGLFSSYEAFIHIVDSMLNQHAKWLRTIRRIPWREPIPSLTYLLSSHVWRQDHNGFSHQDPGFLDHVAAKKSEVVRLYLPPDANSLLAVTRRCLQSRNLVNVVVAGKQEEPQWLGMDAAEAHLAEGFGTWGFASDPEPDAVLACAGDVPTLEALAAAALLRTLPDFRLRVVNVVDLMSLQAPDRHPHGAPDEQFRDCFTVDRPVVFAFHGYPGLVHRLIYRRPNHDNFHVHGYDEEGATTTPFEMAVLNEIDRFHLVLAVLKWTGRDDPAAETLARRCRDALEHHHRYVREKGEDPPAIADWLWPDDSLDRAGW